MNKLRDVLNKKLQKISFEDFIITNDYTLLNNIYIQDKIKGYTKDFYKVCI